MKTLRVASLLHAFHGFFAGALGLVGIIASLRESHMPESDLQLFCLLLVVGPSFALWTLAAARHASGPGRRRWSVPRAVFAAVACGACVFAGIGALGFAGTGAMGAGFFVLITIGCAWLALIEGLIVAGVVMTRP